MIDLVDNLIDASPNSRLQDKNHFSLRIQPTFEGRRMHKNDSEGSFSKLTIAQQNVIQPKSAGLNPNETEIID